MRVDELKLTGLLWDRVQAAGLRATGPYKSQRGFEIDRGLSQVRISSTGVDIRIEGESKHTHIDPAHLEDERWLDEAVGALKVGRTKLVGEGVGLRDRTFRVHSSGLDWPFAQALKIRDGDDPWSISPDYQRGSVWSLEQQKDFVGFFLENGKCPDIYLNDSDVGLSYTPYEVIDGKQRLTAVFAFLDGVIPARMFNGDLLWWRDFDEIDRRVVPHLKFKIVKLPKRADILDFYLRLNSRGVPHTEDELERVRGLLEEAQAE